MTDEKYLGLLKRAYEAGRIPEGKYLQQVEELSKQGGGIAGPIK